MRAHYKWSKHLISMDWFRLWLSPAFEEAVCVNPPQGVDPDTWGRHWTDPASPAETSEAIERCLTPCPALMQCRALVSLGTTPRGVVQAGHAYGLRTGGRRSRVASVATPTTEDEDEAC